MYFFRHFNGDVYGWRDIRYVFYKDATVFFDAKQNIGTITSEEAELLYHYTYYMIIAKVGEFLDCDGMHRFHSLGVCMHGRIALFSMPISGGKTTIGFALMRHKDVQLLSEDTPLIDQKGYVWPFPLRLSLRPGHNNNIPKKYQRIKKDPISGIKELVDLSFFESRQIATEKQPPLLIFWGIKTTLQNPKVKRLNSTVAMFKLVFFIVIGKDCPQRSEIFLRFSLQGIMTICKILYKRFMAAINLWKKTQSYYFFMTADIEKNVLWIMSFINDYDHR